MEQSDWLKETNRKLDYYISSLDKKKVNRFRLEILKRIAVRTDKFSNGGCLECVENKESINKLLIMLEENENEQAAGYKSYSLLVKKLIEHLQKVHGLIEEGANVSTWMPLGMMFGMCFGMCFGMLIKSIGLSIGLSLGLAIGVAVGAGMDDKAKKEGKMI